MSRCDPGGTRELLRMLHTVIGPRPRTTLRRLGCGTITADPRALQPLRHRLRRPGPARRCAKPRRERPTASGSPGTRRRCCRALRHRRHKPRPLPRTRPLVPTVRPPRAPSSPTSVCWSAQTPDASARCSGVRRELDLRIVPLRHRRLSLEMRAAPGPFVTGRSANHGSRVVLCDRAPAAFSRPPPGRDRRLRAGSSGTDAAAASELAGVRAGAARSPAGCARRRPALLTQYRRRRVARTCATTTLTPARRASGNVARGDAARDPDVDVSDDIVTLGSNLRPATLRGPIGAYRSGVFRGRRGTCRCCGSAARASILETTTCVGHSLARARVSRASPSPSTPRSGRDLHCASDRVRARTARGSPTTWSGAYVRLHRLGVAHSVGRGSTASSSAGCAASTPTARSRRRHVLPRAVGVEARAAPPARPLRRARLGWIDIQMMTPHMERLSARANVSGAGSALLPARQGLEAVRHASAARLAARASPRCRAATRS